MAPAACGLLGGPARTRRACLNPVRGRIMSASRTIFITGGTGLVGSHAVEEALRRGHRVRALVRSGSDTRWLDRWGVEKVPGDLVDADTRSKTEAEALALQYYTDRGLPVAIVRPGFIYGERDRTVLPKLLKVL